MRALHFPAAMILGLAAASAGWAQTCALAEVIKPGDCFRYGIDMKLAGEMRFQKEAGAVPVKLNASASHAFPERILAADGAMVQKVARIYETAKLTIERGNERSSSTLRPSRKLIVAQHHKDQALSYSPAGALYRNEVDLVSGHFDTLMLVSILPGKAIRAGETWKIPSAVAQSLCGLEGLTENKLEGKLTRVGQDEA